MIMRKIHCFAIGLALGVVSCQTSDPIREEIEYGVLNEDMDDEDDYVQSISGKVCESTLDSLAQMDYTFMGGSYQYEYAMGLSKLNNFGVYPKPGIDPMEVKGCNWMSYMQDQTLVKHLSIPGSHDATTYGCGCIAKHWAQDQVLDIRGQFNWGTRYFDVRCYTKDKRIGTTHGGFDCNVWLEEVFSQLKACLMENPGEGVIVDLTACCDETPGADKEKDRKAWFDCFHAEIEIIRRNHPDIRFVEPSDNLSLGDLRGKICIVWDDNQDDYAKEFFCSHSTVFGTGTTKYDSNEAHPFDSRLDDSSYNTCCQDGSVIRHLGQNIWERLLSNWVIVKDGSSKYEFSDGLYWKISASKELIGLRYLTPELFNDVWHVNFLSGCNSSNATLSTELIAHLMNYVGYVEAEYDPHVFFKVETPLSCSLKTYVPLGIMPMDFIGCGKYSGTETFGQTAPKIIYMHNFFGGNPQLYLLYL